MAILRLCFLLGVVLVESLYALSCRSDCDKTLCVKPSNCRGGYVKGICGCCDVCAKIQGEHCGGLWRSQGQCAKGLKCVSRSQMKKQKGFLPEYFQIGICEPDACEEKECGFRQVCLMNKRGKPVCKCPRNCGKIRKPVCGLLNGKQYRNKCKLNREECMTKTEIGMLVGKCKKCTYEGQKYKFGDTRPDVKQCEICTCRHSSWKCQMKPNCSMNNLPKHTKGRHSCLAFQDGIPCPNGFACKLSIADTVVVGVCKKEKVKPPKKVLQLFEIISYSNIALTKKDLSEENEENTKGTNSPTDEMSESEFSAEIYSTKRNTDFVSTVAPTMGRLKKQQLKGGLIRHVCMAKADKGTCRPALLTRWFYNASSKTCEQFKYGGCAGNFNNFLSKEKCQEVCHSDLYRDPWEPTATTQSSPLFMTTKLSEKHDTDVLMEMCHDMKTGMSYRDGEKWSLDECTSCSCVSGRALCIAASCRVTCFEPRKVEGKCCPVCEPDLEHSGKAVDTIKTSCEDTKTGVKYNSGESWSRNECVHCNCFNGESSCMTSVCTKPLCEHPITRDGVCCPVCPEDEKQVPTPTAELGSKCKDQKSGELYSIGEAWNVNECVTCFCGKKGQSICHELTCLELKCKNPVHLQGRCCPVCPKSFLSACTYDNRPYFQGDLMLLEDMCTLCKCDGNAWNCTEKHCNKSANGIDSSFNIQLEKLNKVKQDHTPKDSWDDLSNEEIDEFIVEDPMRMTKQSNKKAIAPIEDEYNPTTTSSKQELIAMFKKRKSSTSSRTNDKSHPVDTLTDTNENIDKLSTEKPQLGSTDKPDATSKIQSLLKKHKNLMWPSGYEDIFRASNYTTVYRTKRL